MQGEGGPGQAGKDLQAMTGSNRKPPQGLNRGATLQSAVKEKSRATVGGWVTLTLRCWQGGKSGEKSMNQKEGSQT